MRLPNQFCFKYENFVKIYERCSNPRLISELLLSCIENEENESGIVGFVFCLISPNKRGRMRIIKRGRMQI